MSSGDGRRDAADPFIDVRPEAVSIINRAYESALARLDGGRADAERRANLARHLLDLAKAGETDG